MWLRDFVTIFLASERFLQGVCIIAKGLYEVQASQLHYYWDLGLTGSQCMYSGTGFNVKTYGVYELIDNKSLSPKPWPVKRQFCWVLLPGLHLDLELPQAEPGQTSSKTGARETRKSSIRL